MSDEQLQATSQDVDRIRDIIFGSQMRDYQQRFEGYQRDLARLQQEIAQLSEQLAEQDSTQTKKVQSLRREMRQADDDQRVELRETAQRLTVDKVERVDLGHGSHPRGLARSALATRCGSAEFVHPSRATDALR